MSRSITRRALLRGATLTVGSALMAACGPAPASPVAAPTTAPKAPAATSGPAATAPAVAASLEKVRMASWSQPIAEQANLYAAQELGWFRDEGLEFEYVPGAGGGDAIKHVLAGNADLAFANLEPMFFALDQGSRLRAIYNIYPENVFNVIALKSKGLARPQDLTGKKVGVYSRASGTYHNLLVILRSAGLKEADVEVIATGVNNFGALLQGQVDAQAATDTGLFLARQQGLGEVDVLWARDVLNTPTDAFVVAEEAYEGRKDFLRRFLRAYKRGSQWMLDNPQQAAELARGYATDGQDVARSLEIIRLRNAATVNDDTRRNGLGWFNLDVLRGVDQALFELGLTRNRVDVAGVFTNELVESL